jgi:hypothetical protein
MTAAPDERSFPVSADTASGCSTFFRGIVANHDGLGDRKNLIPRHADTPGMLAERLGVPRLVDANWRMQIATGLLSSGNPNIATIAAEVGYGSEAAFSRAFKKIVGVPPSDWRRRA